jgi:hypothetical protein
MPQEEKVQGNLEEMVQSSCDYTGFKRASDLGRQNASTFDFQVQQLFAPTVATWTAAKLRKES